VTPRFATALVGYSRRDVDGFIEALRATTRLVVDTHVETVRIRTANAGLERELAEMAAEAGRLLEREAELARAITDARDKALQVEEDARTLASQMLAAARDDLTLHRGDLLAAERGLSALVAVLESLMLQHAAGIADRPETIPDRTVRRQ